MEAISPGTGPRAALVAAVLLACLVGLAGAALPAANATAAANLTATPDLTAVPTAVATPTAAAPFTLVLDAARSPAVYGDTVRCSGSGAGNATVRVYVDGAEAGRVSPGASGAYRFEYLVDRLPAGTHVVRAEAGPAAAAEATLEVAAIDPVVLLEAAPSAYENESALLCTGNVTAAGRPVPGAAVRLVFDGAGPAECTTGPAGQFELLAGLAGGSHEVVANVSFPGDLPINPGSSTAVRAALPSGLPVLPIAGLLVVLLVGAGGLFFWRRGRKADAPAGPAPAPAARPPAPEPAPAAPPVEDLRAAARRLAGDGGRDGVEAVYHGLVERLAAREPSARLGSMTPRELAAHLAGTPAGVAVARVAACYEAVAYAGRAPTPVDVETVVEGFVAALAETARAGQ